MGIIQSILSNKVLLTAALGWLAASVIKVIIILLKEKRLRVKLILSTGGMPSSHTAFVAALTTGVGLVEGFSTGEFALAVAFAIIVMVDAAGVRHAAGEHAKMLNQITELLESVLERGEPLDQKKLKELLGHSKFEVLIGALVGIVIALLFIQRRRY